MLGILKRLAARKKGFDFKIEDKWMAYSAIDTSNIECVFPYFDKDKKYVTHSVGDVVPVTCRNGMTAFYRITRIKGPRQFYDAAMWDDGKNYWMVFHHIEEVTV